MKEWLIRLILRPYATKASDVPFRTLEALVKGGWIVVEHWIAIPVRKGREWAQAFKDGEKSIGGRP